MGVSASSVRAAGCGGSDQRLPLAAAAKDLLRGRRRRGRKKDFLEAIREAAADLEGVSSEDIATAP
jgi:hypothetical protein